MSELPFQVPDYQRDGQGVDDINTVVTLCLKPAIDLFCETERLVDDGKSRCRELAREPGGGGINVARNLHAMGVDALAVFAAGGTNGRQVRELLEEEGVPVQCLDIADNTGQNIGLTDASTGKMYHLVFPGQRLDETEWQNCLDYISSLDPAPTYLVLSGSLPEGAPDDFYGRIATDAKAKGIRTILDASGRALAAPLKAGVYLAKLNGEEFAESGYSGSLDDYQSMLAAMADMVADGIAEALIVTLDAEGALLASRDGDKLHVRPPRVKVASHIGAGDSFVSGFVYQMHRGKSLPEAYQYGVAAAAAKVQIPGNHLNNMELVEDIYRQIIR
ncbi:1-phosphofructokinase family hexose kinase [Marinobacter sp.]|uniref:1-phosphofructokinase family hexose kinase n=1 Tax=Marinobacter sp. TaxID=50741 RepID=UPI002B474348|nr:1-phosphofructokinase family hexose kinase [Marinobacter sp.]HKK54681.1 1-phosphofructokinase family hexose kinase [Marinobacter sp.]